jgi:hypothetical protein
MTLRKTTLLCTLSASLLLSHTSVAEPDKTTKLFEPFAPKPSHPLPPGWELQILKGSKVENKTTLKNNKEIKVTVPAYELVPVPTSTNSSLRATILQDPGFKPDLANNQTDTIGAVLTEYSESTTFLEEKLQGIIDTLEKELGTPTANPQPAETRNDAKKSNSPSR